MTTGPTVGSVSVDFNARNDKLKRVARESVQVYKNTVSSFRQQANVIGDVGREWDRATSSQEKHTQTMRSGLPTWKEAVKVFDQTAGQLGVLTVMAPSVLSLFQGLAAAGGALVAGLAPLAGVAGAGAVGITTLAQGAGVLKLALKDVTKSENPLHSALDRMTKDVGGLEVVAKATTLPLFAKSVDRIRGLMPLAGGAVRATGLELGKLADQGSRMMTSGPWRRDFAQIAGTNVSIIRSLGGAGLSLADALRHVLVEAGPMTLEFSHMAQRGAKTVDIFLRNARASGDLSRFFHDTVDVTGTLLRSVSNLGVGLFRLLSGGKELGTDMLHSFEHLTEKFRAWTGTAEGQQKINKFFEQGRATLEQLGSFLQIAGKHAGMFIQAALGISNVISSILDNVPGLKSFVAYWVTLGTLIKITSLGSAAKGFAGLVVHIKDGVKWLIALRGAEEVAGDAAVVMGAKQAAASGGAIPGLKALAAANTTVGTSSAAAAGMGGLAGLAVSAGIVGIAAVVTAGAAIKLKDSLKDAAAENDKFGRTATVGGKGGQLFAERVTHAKTAAKGLAEQTSVMNDAMAAGIEPVKGMTRAQLNAAIATQDYNTALADARVQIKAWGDDAIHAAADFQGSLAKTKKVGTSDVLSMLRSQRDNTRTFMGDVRKLLAAGFAPDAIKSLAEKGPEYVHALAGGSGKQMALAKQLMQVQNNQINKNWAGIVEKMARAQAAGASGIVRNQKTNMARYGSVTAAELRNTTGKFREHVQSVNAALNGIQDEKIGLSMGGSGQVTWSAQATKFKFNAGRMAGGGRIMTGTTPKADDVLVRASKGETMVSAEHSADPWFRSWAGTKGIPGYAGGGLITGLRAGQADQWARMVSGQANRMGAAAASAIGQHASSALVKAGNQWASGMFPGIPGGAAGAPRGAMQRYAQALLQRYGWGNQWGAFNALEMSEAGWNPFAQNPISTAYGLGQFLNSTWATVGGHKTSNWALQLQYMMKYISQRWGSPANAWGGYHARGNWYDLGGDLPTGVSVAVNNTGKPEKVLGPGAQVRLHPDDIKALARELSKMPIKLDGRKVDRGIGSAHQLNDRRRGV